MKFTKIAALLLSAALLPAGCSTGASEDTPAAPAPTDAAGVIEIVDIPDEEPIEVTEPPSDAAPSVPAELPDPTLVVASIDGSSVKMDEFLYFTHQSLLNQQSINAAVSWDMVMPNGETLRDFCKTDALNTAMLYRAIEALAADEGVELSEESRAFLDTLHERCIAEAGSEEAYQQWLDEHYATRDIFHYANYINYLYLEVYNALYGDAGSRVPADTGEAALEFAEENNYIKISHIIIYTTDSLTGQPLSDSAKAEKLALAEEALAKLEAGEDFLEVAAQYSDAGSVEPFTFMEGQMTARFEEAAFALETGEFSEIIETDYGYHIICRFETDPQEIWDNYYSYSLMDEELISRLERMELITLPDYDNFDAEAIFGSVF